jgi:hypothetical protein
MTTTAMNTNGPAPALNDPSERRWWLPTPEARRRGREVGSVASILINFGLLYAAHNLLAWRVSFVTPAWADVLWAIDLSLQASIVANALFLVYDAGWFRHTLETLTIGCALVATYQLYALFPFELGRWDALARLGLLGMLLALAIALVVTAVIAVVAGASRAIRGEGGAG